MEENKQIERINKIIKDTSTCMLVSLKSDQMNARPMQIAKHDSEGNIWFLTDEESSKVQEIYHDHDVLLAFSNLDSNSYLSINGKAVIVDDQEMKKELFNIFAKAWFPEGPESDKLVLIKVNPSNAEYWDGSGSKLVQLFKMGKAVLTNEKYQTKDEDHGEVSL